MAKRTQTDDERESLRKRIHEFRQVFDMFDKDGDGSLSLDEVQQILKKMGQSISHSELNAIVEEFDSNQNGKLEFSEFLNLVLDSDHHEGALEAAFRCYDGDGDGLITTTELRHVLQELYNGRVSDRRFDRMLRAVDTDGDGKIDFKEFSRMMTK